MKEIVVATTNKGKVVEIAAAFAGLPVRVISLAAFADIPEVVEDGLTFYDNAVKKASHYARYTGKACLADDSGLEVDALDGAPGVYSARFAGEGATDEDNNAKLLADLQGTAMDNRTARFRCVLAFVDGDSEAVTADGVCEGVILDRPRGSGGFGYDPLFLVPGRGKTLAELSAEEKNSLSHRGQALKIMVQKLTEV